MAVGSGVGEGVGSGVGIGVEVGVAVGVEVGSGVEVGVAAGVEVGSGVGWCVCVGVAVAIAGSVVGDEIGKIAGASLSQDIRSNPTTTQKKTPQLANRPFIEEPPCGIG